MKEPQKSQRNFCSKIRFVKVCLTHAHLPHISYPFENPKIIDVFYLNPRIEGFRARKGRITTKNQ